MEASLVIVGGTLQIVGLACVFGQVVQARHAIATDEERDEADRVAATKIHRPATHADLAESEERTVEFVREETAAVRRHARELQGPWWLGGMGAALIAIGVTAQTIGAVL